MPSSSVFSLSFKWLLFKSVIIDVIIFSPLQILAIAVLTLYYIPSVDCRSFQASNSNANSYGNSTTMRANRQNKGKKIKISPFEPLNKFSNTDRNRKQLHPAAGRKIKSLTKIYQWTIETQACVSFKSR